MYSPGSTRENTVLFSAPDRTSAKKLATVAGAALPYRPEQRGDVLWKLVLGDRVGQSVSETDRGRHW
jgi:hypothetical protein